MSVANNECVKELDSVDSIQANSEGAKELDHVECYNSQADAKPSAEDANESKINEENPMPFPQQEECVIKKKYGGILPKKPPLISKDHERAFFDSADWALGKQGQKSKGPLEALRPKLQPTPHQQPRARREAYATAVNGEEDVGNDIDTAAPDDRPLRTKLGSISFLTEDVGNDIDSAAPDDRPLCTKLGSISFLTEDVGNDIDTAAPDDRPAQ